VPGLISRKSDKFDFSFSYFMTDLRSYLINRREFLYRAGALTAAISTPSALYGHRMPTSSRSFDATKLAPFVDPLQVPALLQAEGVRPHPAEAKTNIPYYRLSMRQAEVKLHRDLMPTRIWGFNSAFPGPTLEARSGQPIIVEWANDLPALHLLPIDHNLEGAEAHKPLVRSVVHLHGGRVPAESDGYPENWFVPGKSSVCFYPMQQDAATLWYHDHAMGINRLNSYAGLFGLFLIRDAFEEELGLPAGKFEIPLILCDRLLDQEGQLFYPVSPDPKMPWVPEVFGDAALVNGKISPFCEVEARPYRLRLLNAANGRFFHLAFANQLEFQQIGSDQGLLAAPVSTRMLTLAPAERADVIVDFSANGGENIVLKSDALSMMQFRVSRRPSVSVAALPKTLRTVVRTPESDAVRTRELLLEETVDPADNPTIMLLNRTRWMAPVTENPSLDSVEIWSLVNGTEDSHPIHLHLVRFQILDRRNFFVMNYLRKRELKFTGPPVPPDPNEMGWKDTVRAEPGMVTRIIVRFEGYAGRYVWHCHILEHGDNEMMRPYDVIVAR
jgi:spore coat protein A, manganese oxidase